MTPWLQGISLTFFGLYLSQLDAFATMLYHSYPFLTWNLEQLRHHRHPSLVGCWIPGIAAPGSEVQKAQGVTDSGASPSLVSYGVVFQGRWEQQPDGLMSISSPKCL